MKRNMGKSFYAKQSAEHINGALQALPTAKSLPIWVGLDQTSWRHEKGFQAIEVTAQTGEKEVVFCPSKDYCKVDHATAFRPIVEGMTLAGIKDFDFILTSDMRRAKLQIYTGVSGEDGVYVGFSARNSYDGSQVLSYGIEMNKKTNVVELVGYRQVCSNGMKIRVPIADAEIVRLETRTKVESLVNQSTRIRHTSRAEERIQALQYAVEAVSLLQPSVDRMIKEAREWKLNDQETFDRLVKEHIGRRFQNRVLEHYAEDKGNDLWALYNAMTAAASHDPDLKVVSRERLLDKAAEMLLVELRPQKKPQKAQ